MNIRKFISVNPNSGPQLFSSEANTSNSGVGVFVTTQSIMSFPVATAIVTTISKVLGMVFPNYANSEKIVLLISIIIGIIIYCISLNKDMNTKDKIIALSLAIINSFFLAASALGIENTFNF